MVGTGASGFAGDGGPASGAILNFPVGISVDAAGNLYFADSGNLRVRKVSKGVITTVAGNGTAGFGGDGGPAISAQLNGPSATAVDAAGSLYFADTDKTDIGNFSRILKVSNGVIASCAITGPFGELDTSFGLAADTAGNLYIADSAFHGVLKLANGVVTAVAGNGTVGFSGDGGPATSAQLSQSFSIAVDSAGNLHIADRRNNRVREVSGGVINTVAGNGAVSFGGDGGPATSAQLNAPASVAVDAAGNLDLADGLNFRVRKVSNGVIATVAGTTGLNISDIAVDAAGNLYIADSTGDRVRRVSNGVVTTVAGNGTAGFSGDGGAATAAQLNAPDGVTVDASGNLYIADRGNSRVRKVSAGVIATVAGNGTAGFDGNVGDGGAAIDARLNDPFRLAVDAAGNLYIADSGRVRRVSNGVITTVAGNGQFSFSGDGGPSINAGFSPGRIAVDSVGNLFITDTNRIRKVSSGVIDTVAGDGASGFSGDGGPATSARLSPAGIAVDSAGKVYFADFGANRIRVLTPGAPVLAIDPSGVVNGASFVPGMPVVAGSIASVFGGFLESSLTTAGGVPLPDNLAGLSVQFASGQKAPLFAVTGQQVNLQVPWELAGSSQASFSVSGNGQTSAAQTMGLAPFAPGIFIVNRQAPVGAILDNATGLLVDSTHPAVSGSTVIQIYCTGLGAVTNQPPSGSPALSDPLSRTTATPTVTLRFIGPAVPAQVLFSGLAPGLVGVYQVNALVPAGLPCSSLCVPVAVQISIGGAVSNTADIAVK